MTQHIFGKECPICGQISYYDKRVVCTDDGSVVRRVIFRGDDGKEKHKLFLKCKHDSCNAEIVHEEDCEDYV